jgi:hypothetical protein
LPDGQITARSGSIRWREKIPVDPSGKSDV